MRKPGVYIGTSGWHYKHWKGTFYPSEIRDNEQFAFYQQYFNTVEINNSFYRLPEGKTFEGWKDQSPKRFLFAVKASRFITHMKKLKVDKNALRKFFIRAAKLEQKLGPVLFQLPPRWKINTERLDEFISRLPQGNHYTFEFRDQTWYEQAVYDILKKYNCAFCIYDLAGHLSPLEVTADFVYVRLHGPGNKYQGSYPDGDLRKWARRIQGWQKDGKPVYLYFDNDQLGYAAFNAQKLISLLSKSLGKMQI
jgi:uncharacterized protein YecE (DUF72 family)